MTKRADSRRKGPGRQALDDSAVRTTVAQGVGALAISVLGLAVAGSISLTASAQSTETARTTTTSRADQPDTSRAEPEPGATGGSADVAAAGDAAKRAENASGESGSLQAFTRDDEGRAGRDSVRASMDDAVEGNVAAERSAQLRKNSEEAGSQSRKAVASARNTALEAEVEAARREEQRAQEAKRKADQAKAAAEKSGGTLLTPPPPEFSAPDANVAAGGATQPIAKGSYRVGARWGEVGSWSRYHTGQDLPAPIGTPIRSAVDGVVMPANGGGWAGIHVIVRAADGSNVLYAHMSRTTVSPGQKVKAGQQIGAVGMTGRTFGPHLHFEYYKPGTRPGDVYSSSDPKAWLSSRGVQL